MADVVDAQLEHHLGQVGQVSFGVTVTDRPWLLPVDALVVSAGPDGMGRLGRALQADLPGRLWSHAALSDLTPETPQVVPLSELAGRTPLSWVILACARDTSRPLEGLTGDYQGTADAAGRGAAAAVRTAARLGAGSVALSLLGGGVIGLSETVAAEVNVRAARTEAQQIQGAELRRMVFVALNERTREAIEAAWAALDAVSKPVAEAAPSEAAKQPPATDALRLYSGSAGRVLRHVAALAGERPVDPSLVLLAALAAGRGGGRHTAGALLRALVEGREEGSVVAGYASALEVPVEAVFTPPPGGPLPDPDAPVLRRARAITAQLGQPPTIRLRHLLAAALTPDRPPPPLVQALGASEERLRQVLRRAISELLPNESPGGWDDVLGIVTDSTVLDGRISRDLVSEERIPPSEDHLGLGTYVSMLATVIAREDTPLPLSVGLFGEWGSGKSYFMGLLRDRVHELGRRADDGYLDDIVQITFNAWHYADTNLWASLGNEIFEQLAGTEATAAERRTVLRTELAKKTERGRELRAANDRAEGVTARLREELDKARAKMAGSARALIGSVAASGTVRAELNKAFGRLGIRDEVEQGKLLSAELGGARTDAEAFRLATRGPRGWLPAGVAGIALGVLAVSVFFADQMSRWLVGGGLTGLAAAVTGVIVVIGRTRSGLRTLTAAATEIKAAAVEHAEEQFAQDLDALRRADARAAVLKSQLAEVLQRVGELGRELAELEPGRRWYGFVTERAASDDYRRELGLISTIRRDFEQLIQLMADWRALEEPDDQHRPIDRIVLYIDDLDRCSSKQVVEVLQAVHLLLAMDLFVVVVGVDPRWLLHSLREEYRTAFRTGAGDEGSSDSREDEDAVWRTTPHDYLEKIFNIPFVLPGMTATSFERLIRELSLGERETAAAPRENGVQRSHDTERPEPSARMTTPAPTRHADDVPTPPSGSGGAAPTADVTVEQGSEVAAIRAGVPPVPRRLTEKELRLLAALGPLVRSPRQAKRLLNLYRMVRSTRDLSPASAFLGSEAGPGEHQAVAVLLGLLTAHPRLLGRLLAAEPAGVLPGGLRHRTGEQTWQQVVAGLTPKQKGSAWQNDVCANLSEADRTEWSALVERVAPATALVGLPGLAAFRFWGPRVARFSFVLSPLAVQEEPRRAPSPV